MHERRAHSEHYVDNAKVFVDWNCAWWHLSCPIEMPSGSILNVNRVEPLLIECILRIIPRYYSNREAETWNKVQDESTKNKREIVLVQNSLPCNNFGCYVQIKTLLLKIFLCYWLVNVIIFKRISCRIHWFIFFIVCFLVVTTKISHKRINCIAIWKCKLKYVSKTLKLHRSKTCSVWISFLRLVCHICIVYF